MAEITVWTAQEQAQTLACWLGGQYDPDTVGGVGPQRQEWGLLQIPTSGGTLTVCPFDTITRLADGIVYLTAPTGTAKPAEGDDNIAPTRPSEDDRAAFGTGSELQAGKAAPGGRSDAPITAVIDSDATPVSRLARLRPGTAPQAAFAAGILARAVQGREEDVAEEVAALSSAERSLLRAAVSLLGAELENSLLNSASRGPSTAKPSLA